MRLENDPTRALVLTADIIGPIVDEPEAFGAVAAANSLSDVWAMGGKPLYALNLAFFPDTELGGDILTRILRGAADLCMSVGVPIVGGHTVRNDDLKFGLSVTGIVDIDQVLSNRTAQAGQALVLSKALGTGIVGSAIKSGRASAEEVAACSASMTRLNDVALATARRHGITACTDVTGFGLLGHLRNICRGSEVSARIWPHRLLALPGALEGIRADKVPGGTRANLAFVKPGLLVEGEEDEALTLLASDAQTSGGLLCCVPAEQAQALVEELRASGHEAAEVGELVGSADRGPGDADWTCTLDFGVH